MLMGELLFSDFKFFVTNIFDVRCYPPLIVPCISDAGRTIAIEFIGGYLKWKAIELSYKGIKVIVKKSKEKKERRRAEQQMQF